MLNPIPFPLTLLICLSTLNQQYVKGKGCPQSIPTINEVYACPKTILEWTKAKERKQCNLIRQNCTTKEDFEYHCLPNAVLGMFVELCAPSKIIVGYHCPSYDMERNNIVANFDQPCKDHLIPCEVVYKSNFVYKYQECFKGRNNKETNDVAAPIVITNDYSVFMYIICIFLSVCVLVLFIHVCCPGYCQQHRFIRKKKSDLKGINKNEEETSPMSNWPVDIIFMYWMHIFENIEEAMLFEIGRGYIHYILYVNYAYIIKTMPFVSISAQYGRKYPFRD